MRKTFLLIFAIILFLPWSGSTQVITPTSNLQELINKKAQDLAEVNRELEATRQQLNQTKAESLSLQRDIRTIDSNINQLRLSIRADEISADKLRLEMQTLDLDIKNIEDAIVNKKVAIGDILRELQKSDKTNLLVSFLRNSTLAEGILEAQSLTDLRFRLAADIQSYTSLIDELNSKFSEVASKKSQVEFRKQTLAAKKEIVEDQKVERQTLLASTKSQESLYEQSVKELMKKQKEIESEIQEIQYALRKDIDPSVLPPANKGVLQNPAPGARLTQGYGRTSFAIRSYKSQWHDGIDLGAPLGTPLYAAEEGVVVAVGNTDNYCPRAANGKYTVIKHPNNLTTAYYHQSQIAVQVGQVVKRGELIGYMGNSGRSTGPHLQLTVFATKTYYLRQTASCGPIPVGGDLNPLNYLAL